MAKTNRGFAHRTGGNNFNSRHVQRPFLRTKLRLESLEERRLLAALPADWARQFDIALADSDSRDFALTTSSDELCSAAAPGTTAIPFSGPGGGPTAHLAPPPVSAPVKAGNEFRVNATTTGDQRFWEPTPEAVAMDADGDFVITWSSQSQDGSGWGVYAQRFNTSGAHAGGEFRVNTTSLGNQQYSTVAMDPDGDFVITWSSLANDVDNLGVYARRYRASGVPQGEEFLVSPEEDPTFQRLSVAAMDAQGNTLIAWSELDPAGGPDPASNVRARLFDADGVALGPAFQVNTTTANLQRQPSVARSDAGQFVVVWRSRAQDGDADGVFARVFAADGAPLTGELQVNQFATGQQIRATVALDAAGNFVVTWYNQMLGDPAGAVVPKEIYARRFAADGAPLGNEFRVNTTTAGDQRYPSIAVDQDGDFAIVWTSEAQDGDDLGIYLQVFDASGERVGNELRVNTTTNNRQIYPDVAMDDDGDFVVAWSSLAQDGEGYGIYAQRYTQPQGFSYPQITNVYPYDDDHAIAEGERLVQQEPDLLVVAFSQNVRTGAGADSVTNRANWRLLRNGDDISSRIDSVDYRFNNNRYEATLVLNSPLTDGQYELRALPNIRNAAGFALDGDFDGTGGDEFSRSFSISLPERDGDEFQVNTFTTGNQSFTASTPGAVDMDAHGNFVVVWTSAGQDGSGQGVYAQRHDAEGVRLGDEFRVNTTTAGNQRLPTVAVAPSGAFVVTWTSAGQDGSGDGVYARLYAADGSPLGGEFPVNTATNNAQSRSSVGMDDAGKFVIAWESAGQDGASTGIYYQRFAADGALLGSETRANTFVTGAQRLPQVAVDADGDFVITWTSELQDGDGDGVYARRFTQLGVPLGAEFRVNTLNTAGNQRSSSVAMTADGDFAIVWHDSLGDTSSDGVYLQRFTAAGIALGSNLPINTFQVGSQSNASVAIDRDGDLVVVWQSFGQESGWGVYGRRFAWNGAPQTGEFLVNTQTAFNQTNAQVAMDADGDFVIAWTTLLQDGSGDGIYAQLYQGFVNTPPTAIAGDYFIAEGDDLSLDASASFDPDGGQTLTYTWDLNNDGVFGDAVGVSPNVTWGQLNALGIVDDGDYLVRLRVTDSLGAASEDFGALSIVDVGPTGVALNQPNSAVEGSAATLTGSFVDPGTADAHELTVNWGDGTIETIEVPLGARTFSVQHVYADDNPTGTPSDQYPITVTVSGDGATSNPAGTSITVNNVQPLIDRLDRGEFTIAEGATLTLTGSIIDPGLLDTHSVLVGWGDGTASAATVNAATRTFTATHVYGDEEPTSQPTITVTLTDDDGGAIVTTTGVSVQNVAPSLSNLQLSAQTVDEGGLVTLTGRYLDAGALDTHTVLVGWGDGAATLATLNTATRTFTASHTYADDNPSNTSSYQYAINLTITDDDGGVGAGQTSITVRNAAPSNVQIDPLEANIEGNEITLSGRFTDPGALDVHSVSIDWGDGNSEVVELPIGVRTFAAQHTYLDDNNGAPYLASVTINDDDLGSVSAERAIHISNAPPEIVDLRVTPAVIVEGGQVTLTGSISDLGQLDTHAVEVNWGDGTTSDAAVDAAVLMAVPVERNDPSTPVLLFEITESGDVQQLPSIPKDQSTMMDGPLGAAFNERGELFISNRHGNVGEGSISRFRLRADGSFVFNGLITGNGLSGVHDLAFSSTGELFAANLAGGSISRFTFDSEENAIAHGTIEGLNKTYWDWRSLPAASCLHRLDRRCVGFCSTRMGKLYPMARFRSKAKTACR